ncbi:AraC family transcriptional regulator [Anaerosporobacter sp.]|uniref:AraC family transcriptional regulator n=1 Tax=Anaerosporobacter sp. TaxID=1872529 RepID=UPI00286EDB0E|nr:AraC family transcriptional regulator [Anaerosporobacter sp.]
MKSCEKFVSPKSDYYVYSPSMTAVNTFFYPLYSGHFIYEGGYSLYRSSYDSFLLMYIQSGSLTLEYEEKTIPVSAGEFVLIDCYKPHAYSSATGWESLWCHFDGLVARPYYTNVISHLGNVFSMTDHHSVMVISKLTSIYETFHNNKAVKEALISKYLTDILTSFLLYTPSTVRTLDYTSMSENIISYINEHFASPLSIEELAEMSGLSQYHFIRVFKKVTGFTPHEYIINTRLNTAKYLLKNSQLSIKDICFNTGFSCESVFCSSFKKNFNATPSQYRSMSE